MPKLTTRPPRMCRDRQQAYVKLDGERIQLGRWGSAEAREAYDRLIAEWLANGRKLPPSTPEDDPVPVAEVLAFYWRHARSRYSAAKVSAVKQAVRIPRQLYGSEPAESFGPKRLAVCRDQMLAKGWSRGYTNEACGWVRRAFRYAAAHELIPSSVCNQLDMLETLKRGEGGRETRPVRPVPRQHVRLVRPRLTRPVRALIALQLLTGARADELVRLRPRDFDRSGGVWTVTYDGSAENGSHKTAHHGKERTLYFGPRAQRIVGLFMRPGRPLDAPLFSPREANAEAKRRDSARGRRENQKPTPTKTGRTIADHYTTASYRRAIHRACDKATVPKWGPHRLRHNAATFLRREFGIEVASIILGHSSLAITQTYAEQNHKRAIEVMKQVG